MKFARYSILAFLLGLVACNVSGVRTDPADSNPNQPDPLDGVNRVTRGLQSLFLFQEGRGALVNDTATPTSTTLLQIKNPDAVSWVPGGGINITSPTLLFATELAAAPIGTSCMPNNAITLEAWVTPWSVVQEGPARIVTYSKDNNEANFMIGQQGQKIEARLRTSSTEPEGKATLTEEATFEDILNPVHVVYTRNGLDDKAYLYVNGQQAGEDEVPGDLSNWDMGYQLAFGNEPSENRPWRGTIHLVAIYCQALVPTEVFQNYSARY
ncbi:MAG: LamG domain-containing protein [Proteobacteria bacterium]|nr:LamG domain-containing protein [Pseudomonadota bacterium]